jgi:hypothetical protein
MQIIRIIIERKGAASKRPDRLLSGPLQYVSIATGLLGSMQCGDCICNQLI